MTSPFTLTRSSGPTTIARAVAPTNGTLFQRHARRLARAAPVALISSHHRALVVVKRDGLVGARVVAEPAAVVARPGQTPALLDNRLAMMVVCAVAPASKRSAFVGHASTRSGTPPFSSVQKSHQPTSKLAVGRRTPGCRPQGATSRPGAGAGTPRCGARQRTHPLIVVLPSQPPGGEPAQPPAPPSSRLRPEALPSAAASQGKRTPRHAGVVFSASSMNYPFERFLLLRTPHARRALPIARRSAPASRSPRAPPPTR